MHVGFDVWFFLAGICRCYPLRFTWPPVRSDPKYVNTVYYLHRYVRNLLCRPDLEIHLLRGSTQTWGIIIFWHIGTNEVSSYVSKYYPEGFEYYRWGDVSRGGCTQQVSYVCTSSEGVLYSRGENIIFEGVLTPALVLGWNQYGGLAGLVCGTQNTSKNSRIG